MDDAATIISTCSRLLANPRTVTETDAHAAVAACQAWLKEHYPPLQHAVVSRRARPRLPPEILNKIFRLFPYDYDKKAVLLACISVNKEWRRHGWPHVWRKFQVRKTLAATKRRFLLPWVLEATNGIHVRDLVIVQTHDSLDYLPSLLAAPIFAGLRCLSLRRDDVNPLHLLVAFRSLPNLTCLQIFRRFNYDQGAWGSHLGWTEQEENETWRMGFGNLKALYVEMDPDGFLVEKLAMGLGSKLESLRIRHSGVRGLERQFDQFLSTVSQKCPNLVDFELDASVMGGSIHRFLTAQQQLVSLRLRINASDETIRTIAASCVNLQIFYACTGTNVTSRVFDHLASGPFLQGLEMYPPPMAGEDIINF